MFSPSNSKKEMIGERYLMDRASLLGEGSSASVYRGLDVKTGETVAIKVVDRSRLLPVELRQVEQEVAFLKTYRHSNIIKLLDVFEGDGLGNADLYLVLEFFEQDLFEYLSSMQTSRLPEEQARVVFRQCVAAVSFLHAGHLAHRDLKLENFVINPGTGVVKLIDFGLSCRVKAEARLETPVGSMAYSPPEMIVQRPYEGLAADIWSLGVVLYCLLLGGLPFFAREEKQMKTKIVSGKLRFPRWINADAKGLICSMLHRNPDARASIHDVVEHVWLNPPRATVSDEEDDDEMLRPGPMQLAFDMDD